MARPKLSSRVVRLSVSIDEPSYADLCSLADSMGVSTAWAVRRSVAEWLVKHRGELPPQMSLLHSNSLYETTVEHKSQAIQLKQE